MPKAKANGESYQPAYDGLSGGKEMLGVLGT